MQPTFVSFVGLLLFLLMDVSARQTNESSAEEIKNVDVTTQPEATNLHP